MIRHRPATLVAILVLVVLAASTATWGSDSVADEQPPTPFEDFLHEVDSSLDPWLEISGTTIADDHAPWLAFPLYELLLGTTPLPCYWDTYAAYWAVAADLRALGQAPARRRGGARAGCPRRSAARQARGGGTHAHRAERRTRRQAGRSDCRAGPCAGCMARRTL